QPPEVAEENAARLAVVPRDAVHRDRRAKGLRAQVLRPRPHVRGAAEALLHAAAHIANHHRVEAGPCHDGETLAVEAPDVELAAQLRQAAPERLARVRDDGDLHRRSAAAPAARQAKTTTIRAATPTKMPPAVSNGWCMPRYMRAVATNVTTATTSVHANVRK